MGYRDLGSDHKCGGHQNKSIFALYLEYHKQDWEDYWRKLTSDPSTDHIKIFKALNSVKNKKSPFSTAGVLYIISFVSVEKST